MPLTARQYFTLRRLHSLTGVVPVGLFLLEHFFTNSFAVFGPKEYAEKIEFLKSLPYLYLLEIFGIALPILFHALLGVWIGLQAKQNVGKLPFKANWMFLVQRVSGLFLVLFIGYHVTITRFAHLLGQDNSAGNLHRLMTEHYANPLVALFYLVGILSASFHFGNGLWGFAIHWGFLASRSAQRRWHAAALGVALALALMSVNSWLAFKPFGLSPVRIFSEGKETAPAHSTLAQPAAPMQAASTEKAN